MAQGAWAAVLFWAVRIEDLPGDIQWYLDMSRSGRSVSAAAKAASSAGASSLGLGHALGMQRHQTRQPALIRQFMQIAQTLAQGVEPVHAGDNHHGNRRSARACAMAVSVLVSPGPVMTKATPVCLETRAYPSAMKPADCSWRGVTWRMPDAARPPIELHRVHPRGCQTRFSRRAPPGPEPVLHQCCSSILPSPHFHRTIAAL